MYLKSILLTGFFVVRSSAIFTPETKAHFVLFYLFFFLYFVLILYIGILIYKSWGMSGTFSY